MLVATPPCRSASRPRAHTPPFAASCPAADAQTHPPTTRPSSPSLATEKTTASPSLFAACHQRSPAHPPQTACRSAHPQSSCAPANAPVSPRTATTRTTRRPSAGASAVSPHPESSSSSAVLLARPAATTSRRAAAAPRVQQSPPSHRVQALPATRRVIPCGRRAHASAESAGLAHRTWPPPPAGACRCP